MKRFVQGYLRKTKYNEQGFTLIELLIYMGLFSILIFIVAQLFVGILDIKLGSEATSAVEQNGRYIMERLSYDITRSSSVITPASLGGSTSSLQIVINGVTYTYSLIGGNLVLTDSSGTYNLNSSETTVSNIVFQRIGNAGGKDTIKIQFTINSVAQRNIGNESRIFNITVGRRQ